MSSPQLNVLINHHTEDAETFAGILKLYFLNLIQDANSGITLSSLSNNNLFN